MKSFALIVSMVLLATFLNGCMKSLSQSHITGPMTYKQKMDMRYNLLRRTYHLHVPPIYDGKEPLPLVVVIHGAFDTAKGMEKVTGFSELADRENFLVLYPNGIGLFGFLQHWNAGHCCGKAADDDVDDVGFIAATIDDACSRLNVDRTRIYMVGFSNGGMMAYRFAAEQSNILAAVAPLAASIGGSPAPGVAEWRIPVPKNPVPVLTMHGREDEDIPFNGGVSPRRSGNRSYWSVPDSVGFWVRYNRCEEPPLRITPLNGQVQITSWKGCSSDAEVLLYEIINWGHVWPGKYFIKEMGPDHPLKNFDAKEIVWKFFKKHTRVFDATK